MILSSFARERDRRCTAESGNFSQMWVKTPMRHAKVIHETCVAHPRGEQVLSAIYDANPLSNF
ncbi:hypothetical protein VARIO8X_20162 [Burkholderiales bacterium 8X]|nr:hypothetical protein VARIO8X_20162 [Burkholderiales bacterium 8X]